MTAVISGDPMQPRHDAVRAVASINEVAQVERICLKHRIVGNAYAHHHLAASLQAALSFSPSETRRFNYGIALGHLLTVIIAETKIVYGMSVFNSSYLDVNVVQVSRTLRIYKMQAIHTYDR